MCDGKYTENTEKRRINEKEKTNNKKHELKNQQIRFN